MTGGLWIGPSLAIGSVTAGQGGVVYEPEAIAYFAAMTTPLGDTQKGYVNTAIKQWKADGVWSLLVDVGLPLHDSQASRVNAVRPATVTQAVNAITFTPFKGFLGDGVNAYLDSTIAVDDASLTQNSQTIYAYVNSTTNDTGSTLAIAGLDVTTGTISFLRNRSATNTVQGRINGTTTLDSGTVATRVGAFSISRTSVSLTQFTVNGVQSGADGSNGSGTVQAGKTIQWFRLATVYNGTDQLAARMIGKGMTVSQISVFHSTMLSLLTSLGAN